MKYHSVHSLRRFNASVQILALVDPRTVSSNLGHSLVSTTMNYYAKEIAQAQAASMQPVVDVVGLPPSIPGVADVDSDSPKKIQLSTRCQHLREIKGKNGCEPA